MTKHEYYEKLMQSAVKRAEYLETKIESYLQSGANDNRVMGFNKPCDTWIAQADRTHELIDILQDKLRNL